MLSKVLPSWPLTNSLLMNLDDVVGDQRNELWWGRRWWGTSTSTVRATTEVVEWESVLLQTHCTGWQRDAGSATYSPVGCSYLPVCGVSRVCMRDMMKSIDEEVTVEL